MNAVLTQRGLRAALVLVLAAVLLAGTVPPPATAQTACPQVMPTSQVTPGMTGTGYTVSKGTSPQSFSVEVLGVLKDGVMPGRDMIIVEVGGNATINEVGGIWFGMSGSPVYVGGKLIGAVAFGLSWSPSKIGGLTAAEDMMDLLDYGTSTSSAGAERDEVALTGALAAEVRERDASTSQAQPRMTRLKTPLAVSGANARGLAFVERAAERSNLSVLPFASSAAAPTAAAQTAPQAGGNFAGAVSYGDLTMAGIGTTTFVCDGYAVAFGHPFFWDGDTTMGANAADALTIIPDDVFGPYKLANVTGSIGTLDEDRLAGIRAKLGPAPATSPVTSTVSDEDTGRTRQGTTRVVLQDAFPFISGFHLLNNIDPTIDRIGTGTMELDWTATGRRESGATWELERGNKFAADWDLAFESIFELIDTLAEVYGNPFEEVSFTGLEITARAAREVRRYQIAEVSVSVDGGPYETADEIMVQPGSQLDVQVRLTARRTEDQLVTLSLEVPFDLMWGATLQVSGGQWFVGGFDEPGFFPEEPGSGSTITTFDELLESIGARPRNDELMAAILPDGQFGDEPGIDEPDWEEVWAASTSEVRERLDRVVIGDQYVRLWVDDGGPGGGTVERVAGAGRVETAVAVSQRVFGDPGGVSTVVVAAGGNYADSLAGAPLAASVGGPLLLSSTHRLDSVVGEEIGRLGATRAFVLGGNAALSEQVAVDLRGAGINEVIRLGGTDRFDTARLIAERLGGEEVYVAEGGNADPQRGWPDAMAVASLAAMQRRPVLLVEHGRVPEQTSRALTALGAGTATVVGGTAAVSDTVVAQLRAAGLTVDRVAGATRYDTSVAVGHRALEAGADPGRVWLVTGHGYADALAAGSAAASAGGVLLLVDGRRLDRSPAVQDWLADLAGYGSVTLVGGPAAISFDVEQQVAELLGGGAWPEPEPEPPYG
jgi:putative cell wall-binding protein